ncbi:GNAT family N-acetyltransferase [Flavivirga eckloniae]|uniref:N-acetyltransferase domain-containing protein n=1 Tax=Flavivirga eckloniae TaxID=1803846 RepID=A0A2K9PR61_9FLAO|nr:GNAT family protein [Flavivirga eckloniae]AUP79544.1 hypothetical protein C1H87_12830 [Flavivirga eckloniae]
MNLLKKLIPKRIEQLVYVLNKNEELPSLKIGFNIEESLITNNYNSKKKKTKHQLLINQDIVYTSNTFEKVHFMKSINEYNSLVIGDCFTYKNYRGLSIYPFMLQKVAKEMFQKVNKIFILVSPENAASIRGIEKAGFTLLYKVSTIRVGVFYFLTRKTYQNKI